MKEFDKEVDKIMKDTELEEYIEGFKYSMDEADAMAKVWIDNPYFLNNMAKVRGMYLKALKRSGFSRKMAEKITFEHFDGYYPDSEV